MPFDMFASTTDEWAYSDCFTIDPSKGAKAWEKLCLNQMGLEIGMLPKTLHEALLETILERKPFEKKAREQVGR